jgi:5-methylcytosine-specific restriction protein A
MLWFGKPNAHSQQPTFKKLFDGTLAPHVFVRWDNKNTSFLYLGRPLISSFKDGIKIKESLETIKVVFEWNKGISNPPPEGIINGASEGNHSFTITNRYERNPALRAACIEYFGVICQVCGFNFESAYGSLGKDYCHVHHIMPLSQMGGSRHVNPLTDLIPLCANCHAMIHRGSTVLLPEDLKRVVNKHT